MVISIPPHVPPLPGSHTFTVPGAKSEGVYIQQEWDPSVNPTTSQPCKFGALPFLTP